LKCAARLEERLEKAAVWQLVGAVADGLFNFCGELSHVYWTVPGEVDAFIRDVGTTVTRRHMPTRVESFTNVLDE
jgi:hypothetical protein